MRLALARSGSCMKYSLSMSDVPYCLGPVSPIVKSFDNYSGVGYCRYDAVVHDYPVVYVHVGLGCVHYFLRLLARALPWAFRLAFLSGSAVRFFLRLGGRGRRRLPGRS